MTIDLFLPHDWYWIVGGDDSRAWSSASRAYVADYPADRLSRIGTEEELSDVLRPYGVQGPYVAAIDVKTEAQRRIILVTGAHDFESCIIKQLNATMRANELNDKRVSGGTLTPEEEVEADTLRALASSIKALREKSDQIELLDPIPQDFTEDLYWI